MLVDASHTVSYLIIIYVYRRLRSRDLSCVTRGDFYCNLQWNFWHSRWAEQRKLSSIYSLSFLCCLLVIVRPCANSPHLTWLCVRCFKRIAIKIAFASEKFHQCCVERLSRFFEYFLHNTTRNCFTKLHQKQVSWSKIFHPFLLDQCGWLYQSVSWQFLFAQYVEQLYLHTMQAVIQNHERQ